MTLSFSRALLSVSALALATTAHAQSSGATWPSDVATDDGAKPSDEILVTGSRIARPEIESPMPVSVVNMQQAERVGRFNAYDALRLDPAIGQGIGLQNSFGQGYDAGISTVALRNLGTNRSLTLIDGMRRVSGSARTSAVDINMIPPALIDRIEVITGGAAAIYGADAVTGAVNIVTKRNLEGLHASVTQGITQYGDGSQTVVSLAGGTNFAGGRGSVVIGSTYSKTGSIRARDRDFSRNRILYQRNAKNTGTADGIPDLALNRDQREIMIGYLPNFWYAPEGQRYIVDNDAVRLPQGGTELVGGQYGWYNGGEGRNLDDIAWLQGSLESAAVIGRVDYELTDDIEYTARFDYGRSKYLANSRGFRQDSRVNQLNNNGGDVAYLDNPYLPAALRDFMTARGLTRLNIDRSYGNLPQINETHDRENYTIYQGLRGGLVGDLRWEAFFQYGRAVDDVRYTNIPRASRYVAARDAIADPVTGALVCRNEAARNSGCVPFSIFSTDPLSQEQLDYILVDRNERRVNTQQIFGGNIVGEIFRLPYGGVSMALGVEHRKDTLKTTDDPLATAGDITYFAMIGEHPAIRASRTVKEIYGELVVPLLRDLPLARRLEIEGAYRYSDYSGYGKTDTWKVGGTWEPVRGVTFRGVRSRSVRAPNFGELFAPQTTSATGTPNDPCLSTNYNLNPTRAANCLALGIVTPVNEYKLGPLVNSGGNPNLKPETSNSLTLGVILQPSFTPGLDVTVDYWDINIKGVISSFSMEQVMRLCVDLPTIDNAFCPLVQRDPVTHAPVQVETYDINAQSMAARGIDFGVNYRTELGAGRLSLGFKGSYLLKQVVETLPGMASGNVSYHGGYANPRFRGTLITSYDLDTFGISLTTRFISKARYDVNALTDEQYEDNSVPARIYNDLALNYMVDERFNLTFGVSNVFNVDPPLFPGANYGGGQYDTAGRRFYATARMNL